MTRWRGRLPEIFQLRRRPARLRRCRFHRRKAGPRIIESSLTVVGQRDRGPAGARAVAASPGDPDIVCTWIVGPSRLVKPASLVSALLNGSAHAALKYTALVSTSRVSGPTDPLGSRFLMRSSVWSATQSLMISRDFSAALREVHHVHAGAVVLRQRVEEGGEKGEPRLSPEGIGDLEAEDPAILAFRVFPAALEREIEGIERGDEASRCGSEGKCRALAICEAVDPARRPSVIASAEEML